MISARDLVEKCNFESILPMPSSLLCVFPAVVKLAGRSYRACVQSQIEGSRPDGSRLGRGLAELSLL